MGVEDRENVIPRSYKEVKAAKLAKEEELVRAAEGRRAAQAVERAAERERLVELAETRRRLTVDDTGSAPTPTKRVSLKIAAPKKPVWVGKAPGKGKSRRDR